MIAPKLARLSVRVLAIGSLYLLTGCPDRSIATEIPVQQSTVSKEIPVSADIDILFVIDNSPSTLDKQTVFSQNFPKFIQALDAFPTGRPNVQIGVVDTTVDIGVQGFAEAAGGGCPSPDTADDGLLQNKPRITGCTPPNGHFLSDFKNTMGGRTINYAGTLDQALSCIALVGASGCGFEQQLEAMKRALDGSRPENVGFIRNGAYLAVIFLTDEDDASVKDKTVFTLPDNTVGGRNDFRVQPLFAYDCDHAISASQPGTYNNCIPRTDSYLRDPNDYVQFLATVKDPSQLVVAAIAAPPPGLMTDDSPSQAASSTSYTTGPLTLGGNTQQLALEPSCSATVNGNPAVGRPALRLAQFVRSYGDRGRFYTVCQSDYSAALTDIGATLFKAISPCLEGKIDPTDIDPVNPGIQLQCAASDVQNGGTASETATLLPACKMTDAVTPAPGGARPCYWIDRNTTKCPTTDTGFELNIERTQSPPTGTTVEVQCAIVQQ